MWPRVVPCTTVRKGQLQHGAIWTRYIRRIGKYGLHLILYFLIFLNQYVKIFCCNKWYIFELKILNYISTFLQIQIFSDIERLSYTFKIFNKFSSEIFSFIFLMMNIIYFFKSFTMRRIWYEISDTRNMIIVTPLRPDFLINFTLPPDFFVHFLFPTYF